MLYPYKIKNELIELIVYNYISANCFDKKIIDDYILILKISDCPEL